MEFTAQQIAALLNGTVEGDPEAKVSNLAKIEEGTPGTLTFLANPAYTHFIYNTGASDRGREQGYSFPPIPSQPPSSGSTIPIRIFYDASGDV